MSKDKPEIGDVWTDGAEEYELKQKVGPLWECKDGGGWYEKSFAGGKLAYVRGPSDKPTEVDWAPGQWRRGRQRDDKNELTGDGPDEFYVIERAKNCINVQADWLIWRGKGNPAPNGRSTHWFREAWPSEVISDPHPRPVEEVYRKAVCHLQRGCTTACESTTGDASVTFADVNCPKCIEARKKWEAESFKDAPAPRRIIKGEELKHFAFYQAVPDRPRVSRRPEGMSEMDIANLVSAAPFLQGAGVQVVRDAPKGVSEAELEELANPWRKRRK